MDTQSQRPERTAFRIKLKGIHFASKKFLKIREAFFVAPSIRGFGLQPTKNAGNQSGGVMSHKHFCDFAGHFWECEGTALRPLAGDTEPSVCMCDTCQVPMEFGNHGGCMVELLACPEHRDAQLRAMRRGWVCPEDTVCLGCGLPMNTHDYQQCMNSPRRKAPTTIQYEPLSSVPHCMCGCADADPDNVVGWCMWCDHVYLEYNPTTEDQHFAHHCTDAPQELKTSARNRLATITSAQSEGES
jgi:hypothetical protein